MQSLLFLMFSDVDLYILVKVMKTVLYHMVQIAVKELRVNGLQAGAGIHCVCVLWILTSLASVLETRTTGSLSSHALVYTCKQKVQLFLMQVTCQ